MYLYNEGDCLCVCVRALKNTANFEGAGLVRSGLRPRPGVQPAGGPSARGASPGMVLWLSGLKLGREMSTHPGRSMPIFAAGLGFAASLDFVAGSGFAVGLDCTRGFGICSGC